MPWWAWTAVALAALYAALVVALLVVGRREHARALAGLIPDCVRLAHRLLRDPRLARHHKAALGALIGYLLFPIDLVPDFIPVAGQLDDAILVVLVLGWIIRGAGPDVVAEHWPGPTSSLRVLLRVAGGARSGSAPRGRAIP